MKCIMSVQSRSKLVHFPEPPSSSLLRYDPVVGTLVKAVAGLDPVVMFAGADGATYTCAAVTTVGVAPADAGRSVILMFLRGDPACPVITGLLKSSEASDARRVRRARVELTGRELVLDADAELTLRCGKSSITLTRDGKIVLRGRNLVSRASAVNRIRGGTIALN